ncbi:hypothetical protein ACTI_01240 [Actinoplanes sp. OR16]|uniref:hypothetical protein n=1 Tax=Actinoplanes sp. OR16 TaxID=946334 RepID=UPI000F6E8523|nr:hypothetical protein [Actinoplanes sp. OR16]BBH63439.1 hypothetical protein ACTI_01240 [Actinoplanes sp. OR16]
MTITVDELTGYVQRDLEADLARWFPSSDPAEVGEDARPVGPFLSRLPVAAAAALAAFDALVRGERVPAELDIADWSYGFDFAANDCGILDSDYSTPLTDDDVYSIGADGGGNYYVVLTNGQVAVWFHEEEVIEANTRFDTVDVFVWSLVRYHAVLAGTLPLAAVEADFLALGQDGALAPDLGMLALMRARATS